MNFVKGAMLGMVAGAIVGVMNSTSIKGAMYKGKRKIKKMQRKYM